MGWLLCAEEDTEMPSPPQLACSHLLLGDGAPQKQLKGAQLNVPKETNGAGPGSGHPALSPSTLHFFQKSFALGFVSLRSRVPAPAGCAPWDYRTLPSSKTLFPCCFSTPLQSFT